MHSTRPCSGSEGLKLLRIKNLLGLFFISLRFCRIKNLLFFLLTQREFFFMFFLFFIRNMFLYIFEHFKTLKKIHKSQGKEGAGAMSLL